MAGRYGLATIAALALLIGCESRESENSDDLTLTWSDSDSPSMSRAEFDHLMQEISNWGRWGRDDQLGTLNLITPEKRRAAAALVRDGVSLSMALDIEKQPNELNSFPFEHEVLVVEGSGHRWSVDSQGISYHGLVYSHLDGLLHVAHKGLLYNGMPIDDLSSDGSVHRLGVQNIGISGIVTRGVLVDFPRYLGMDFVPAGTAISAADLEAWEKASGVTVSSGDALLIRTGRWAQVAVEGQSSVGEQLAGLHASVASWLRERDVSVIGSDAGTDVVPSGVEGVGFPLHELVIAGLGMPMMDNLDLEEVADAAARRNRAVFLFVGSPIRVPGGTGAPINPLAIF